MGWWHPYIIELIYRVWYWSTYASCTRTPTLVLLLLNYWGMEFCLDIMPHVWWLVLPFKNLDDKRVGNLVMIWLIFFIGIIYYLFALALILVPRRFYFTCRMFHSYIAFYFFRFSLCIQDPSMITLFMCIWIRSY